MQELVFPCGKEKSLQVEALNILLLWNTHYIGHEVERSTRHDIQKPYGVRAHFNRSRVYQQI